MTEELTRKQTAEALGVTRPTVTRWLQVGYIQGRKVGPWRRKQWRVPRSEVDRLLADRLLPEGPR